MLKHVFLTRLEPVVYSLAAWEQELVQEARVLCRVLPFVWFGS